MSQHTSKQRHIAIYNHKFLKRLSMFKIQSLRSNGPMFGTLIGVLFMISSCDVLDAPYYGCTNPLADNYNANATHDDGTCVFDPSLFRGCIDTAATNYDATALVNDCHCQYTNVRKVLVEDYTGHTCGNCPRAAEKLKELECQWGDRVVPMAIHAGFFALPESNANGSYATDHRTAEGNEYNTTFGNSALGLPNGLVNRKSFSGQFPQDRSVWAEHVAAELALPAEAYLTMQNTYSEASRTVNTSIDISVLSNLNNGPYYIIVALTEDSIVDWQKDYELGDDENIAGYVHNHAHRVNFNGTWGTQVGTGNLAAGQVVNVSYSLQLNPDWRDAHCNVVAFVYRQDTKEVLQAEYRPVVE
jgi:hypothetical protein